MREDPVLVLGGVDVVALGVLAFHELVVVFDDDFVLDPVVRLVGDLVRSMCRGRPRGFPPLPTELALLVPAIAWAVRSVMMTSERSPDVSLVRRLVAGIGAYGIWSEDRPLVDGIGVSAPPPIAVGVPAAVGGGEAPIAGVGTGAIGFCGDVLDEEDNRALLIDLNAKLSLLNVRRDDEVTGFIVTEITVS